MIIENNGLLYQDFFELQKDLNPDFAIEVGAHAAEFSLAMSADFGISAIAFEANPPVFDIYKEQCNNELVKYVNNAITNYDGIIKININSDQLAGNNSIKIRQNAEIQRTYDVYCYKLDTYLKDIQFNNAALWIDVEGANMEVLSGAVETLSRCKSIFIETEDVAFWEDQWLTQDVESFLASQGFTKVADEEIYTNQRNIIFVKEETK